MQLRARLEKLEQACMKTVTAITDSYSDKVLLSTGQLIDHQDLKAYPNIVLFSLDKTLELIAGDVKTTDSTTIARLIIRWRAHRLGKCEQEQIC